MAIKVYFEWLLFGIVLGGGGITNAPTTFILVKLCKKAAQQGRS
jgi:hypothetical protein